MSRRTRRWKNTAIYLVVVGLLRLLALLPRRAAVGLGRTVGLLAWLLGRTERRRALANLQRAGVGESPADRRRLTRAMFGLLGRNAMECVVMGQLRPRLGTPDSPVQYAPGAREALARAVDAGRGVLFVTGHLGNWELMAAEVARMAPVSVLYKPSYDPRFTDLINNFRSLNGVSGISVREPGHLRQVLAALARGAIVGVLLDQHVPTGCQVSFFGRPAWTSNLVARLHRTTGAPVVVGYVRSHHRGSGKHILHINNWLDENSQEMTAMTRGLSRQLEAAVRQMPDQWLWSLDRWHPGRSTEMGRLSSPNANCIPAASD